MSEQVIYNKIGAGYNTTRKADPYIADRLCALLNPATDKLYLDIGCGTGNYTISLAEMGIRFIGIDPSELMLEKAREKSDLVRWMPGTAEGIPLPDKSIDGAIATLTMHHWTDHKKAFSELARVLNPGGKLVVFTFTPEQEKEYWFNHFFPEMMQRGMQKSMTLETIRHKAGEAGLVVSHTDKYFVQDDLQDMFGYSGKHDPERYFDPVILNGISYFSIYAEKSEVERGLLSLREAIDNGQFNAIKEQYDKGEGDYLFVVLEQK